MLNNKLEQILSNKKTLIRLETVMDNNGQTKIKWVSEYSESIEFSDINQMADDCLNHINSIPSITVNPETIDIDLFNDLMDSL